MKVSLSICNPIFNNEDTIDALVKSVERELEKCGVLLSSFELVLFNNQSTDNSGKIASDYAARHAWVKYHESDKHLPPGESLLAALSLCNNEYVWFIGDDMFLKGGILKVLRNLITNRYDILVTSSLLGDKDGRVRPRACIGKLDYLPSLMLVVKSLGHSMNHFFIGNIVIRKQVALTHMSNCASNWPHTEALISYFESGATNFGKIVSCESVLESESAWYSCGNYDPMKRSALLAELLDIGEMKCSSEAAKEIQKQAVALAASFMDACKVKIARSYLLKRLYRCDRKLFWKSSKRLVRRFWRSVRFKKPR